MVLSTTAVEDRSSKPRRPFILYLTYWSLRDPLCESQSLGYLRRLAGEGYRFGLMTWEQASFRMERSERRRVRKELEDEGILWFPLKYHKRFPMLATSYDILKGILYGIAIAVRYRPDVYHARSSVASLIAMILAALTGKKFLYDADGMLSEEEGENLKGYRKTPRYIVTKMMEKFMAGRADAIVTLTERMKEVAADNYKITMPFTEVIPCCVDLGRYRFLPEARERIRKELGIAGRDVFIYTGKFGGLYLAKEMLNYFQLIAQRIPRSYLLIITHDSRDLFSEEIVRLGLSPDQYSIHASDPAGIPDWLSAADIGFSILRPSMARLACSPIKNGEYLACGIPIISTPNIGDYSEMIEKEGVGFILDMEDEMKIEGSVAKLRRLLSAKEENRRRCREVAARTVSLDTIGVKRYLGVYEVLFENAE